MPIKCPTGEKPRYRVMRKGGENRRLAFCGPTKVVENIKIKLKERKKRK